ncbi:OLC1v1002021C1 [Oldenlandia corymbosa var. corymbosa]|uniref:OLC1v1002021C1 n=1 Tax=Oldenlandia corymbosa var. corymbosa TaxID=529605 RepID=A0AAV1D6R8_OLDCO|nr:OLC1v1002021C1 [Oldenlandia corymbosa var. corymbosa]
MASESDQRYAMMDEKKRKRMISNRESARRSRMRKQKQMQDLTDEISKLEVSNNAVVTKMDEITDKYTVIAAENNVLRAQVLELTERLRLLNDVIKKRENDVNGNQLPDRSLKPWQLSCSMSQPIPASSPLFQNF